MEEDDFDCEEWKPLSQLSPVKTSTSNLNRNSIFHKFDPFASKTILNENSQQNTDQSRSKWRLTNIFGSNSPVNKPKKENAQKIEEEDNFKEPVPTSKIAKPVENYQDQHPCYTKKEFDDLLRAYKHQSTEKFQNRQKEMRNILENLESEVLDAKKKCQNYQSSFNEHFFEILTNSSFLSELIPDFEESREQINKYVNESANKALTKVKSLKDSCNNIEQHYEKLIPSQNSFMDLVSEEAALKSELENIEKLNIHKVSELNRKKDSYQIQQDKYAESYKEKSFGFDEKISKLEKDLKLEQYYMKTEAEKLRRCQEDLEEANNLINDLRQ